MTVYDLGLIPFPASTLDPELALGWLKRSRVSFETAVHLGLEEAQDPETKEAFRLLLHELHEVVDACVESLTTGREVPIGHTDADLAALGRIVALGATVSDDGAHRLAFEALGQALVERLEAC
jgi:hypothetical protein